MSLGTPRAVAETVDAAQTVDLLQSLVQIESPYFHETAIIEFVHDWLDERGLNPDYHRVSEPDVIGYEGQNVLARIEGTDPSAPTLLLNGHVDTVELVADWTEDPLSGRIEDGRLYGQGAADMKGGLAAAMSAFAALADADAELAGDVVLTAVVDEEGPYGLGTDQLIRDGRLADCDMAIVPEPGPAFDSDPDATNPRLYLGARGRFLYDIQVHGTAAHGSMPDRGANAVIAAGRIAAAFEEMEVGSHPLLGSGSVCPLRIEGGSETLSVPESCRLLVDRHVVAGETEASVLADAEAVVDSLDLGDIAVEISLRETPHPEARYGPYTVDESEPLVEGLATATEAVTGKRPTVGYFPSVGDFNYLGHREGLPTVILGPDGENVHSAGEWVDLEEVVEVARILSAGAVELVGAEPRTDTRFGGAEDGD